MASSRPNILFILADDLGYADVSCYGRRDFTTSNIDRIAAEGVRFTQAYANSAVCTAPRVALITGRYQYRLAVERLELELGPVEPVLLSLSEKPIAPPSITGPRRAHLGEIAEFHIRSNSPAKQGVIHLDVADPEGGTIAHYSENLVVDG